MENNQEHKIDKIFNNSLDNQEIIPPLDAWMSVHTYTIGQEEAKKRVWFRYASLSLMFLLFLGLGMWYYVENQISVVLSVKIQTTTRKMSAKTQTTTEKKDKLLNELDGNKLLTKREKSIPSDLFTTKMESETFPKIYKNNDLMNSQSSKQSTKKSIYNLLIAELSNVKRPIEREPLVFEIEDDSAVYGKEEFVYPVGSYFNINNLVLETIEPKPLILNDLSYKFQKENQEIIKKKFLRQILLFMERSLV
jgi:hypothetical protein